MRKLVQFLSLTVLTQAVLAANQIVLLPIQIRTWGQQNAAHWYSMLAIAGIIGIADFGLRSAGHAPLIRYAHNSSDLQARTEFSHLWAWTRILVCVVTVALIGLDLFWGGHQFWHTALIVSVTLETLILTRVGYLDSLQLYRQAEAGYLSLVTARLCLSFGALIFCHASPLTLSMLLFLIGIFALAHQNRLCRRTGLLGLFEPIPPGLSFRILAIARHTVADPASNWMRNSLPVLVLSAIAQPIAVTTYVALRAVFGAARQMAMQLSRYVSVRYVHAGKSAAAQQIILLSMLSAGFATSILGYVVLVDNFRLASFWLKSSPDTYGAIATIFALSAPLYAYQIIQAVMLRHGKVRAIAQRQYLYIGSLAAFALIALLVKSVLFWLVLILVAEVGLSVSFIFQPQTLASLSVRPFLVLLLSMALTATLAFLVRFVHLSFIEQVTAPAVAGTLTLLSLWVLASATVYLLVTRHLLTKKTAE
jgi:hypothetical protein